jgi:hypothetical protein
MNVKHTPGPWRIAAGVVICAADHAGNSAQVATTQYSAFTWEEEERNAERIVSCVNACAGIEDPAAYIEAMRRELRRLVDLCDTEATMFDGSNPDTRAAHALLGDFDKPADEDDGGWRY